MKIKIYRLLSFQHVTKYKPAKIVKYCLTSVKSISYPGASPYSVDYEYHPGTGLLSTVTGSDDTVFASFPSYIASSKIQEINSGNGAKTTYMYDPESTRLTNIETLNGAQAQIINKAYQYSAAGDITDITDGIAPSSYHYEYDKLHRLTSEMNLSGDTATTASVLSYAYERKSLHGVDWVTNEITGTPYEFDYDDNGNLVSGFNLTNPDQPVLREINFNADNMPTSIDMGGTLTASITYDGENTRAVKESTNGATYYINQYFEVENGVETKYIFGNNTRIAKIGDTDTYYYHKDHLGSTTVITGSDGLVNDPPSEFMPYGMDRNSDGQNVSDYKFTDQEQDDEIGLYNYNARLYDPALGVFISPDTFTPDWFDPQMLNRFAYVRNNPFKYIDPSGNELYNINIDGAWFNPYGHNLTLHVDDITKEETYYEVTGPGPTRSNVHKRNEKEFIDHYKDRIPELENKNYDSTKPLPDKSYDAIKLEGVNEKRVLNHLNEKYEKHKEGKEYYPYSMKNDKVNNCTTFSYDAYKAGGKEFIHEPGNKFEKPNKWPRDLNQAIEFHNSKNVNTPGRVSH